jgi:hypothetical protein
MWCQTQPPETTLQSQRNSMSLQTALYCAVPPFSSLGAVLSSRVLDLFGIAWIDALARGPRRRRKGAVARRRG